MLHNVIMRQFLLKLNASFSILKKEKQELTWITTTNELLNNFREHKSEYKNRFRPFSQYEYIGDGKFFNTSTSPPNEIDNPTAKFPLKHRNERTQHLSGEPWYQEVIELRKQANDYKVQMVQPFRGNSVPISVPRLGNRPGSTTYVSDLQPANEPSWAGGQARISLSAGIGHFYP